MESTSQQSILDSTVASVDTGEELIRAFLRASGFSEDEEYFIGLASREILANAVKHGNRYDPNKKVSLTLSRDTQAVTIVVSDQGQGFQLDRVPDPLAPENIERRSGRGLMMALSIMDQLQVDRSPGGGTSVRMVKNRPAA